MQWNEEKDTLLMREMESLGVSQHKSGSRGRSGMAKNYHKPNKFSIFSITLHAIREDFNTIGRKHKAKTRKEVHGTGIDWGKPAAYETLL